MNNANSRRKRILDTLAITASFVFLKENLIFESVEDRVLEEGLVLDREKDDYIFKKPRSRQFSVERLIKLLITKDKSTEFIKILKQMECHQHVYEKIQENRQWAQQPMFQDSINNGHIFSVTEEMLQRHFTLFYMELEPRAIADEMFQKGHISANEHDDVTEFTTKYKRVKELFSILRKRPGLYYHLSCVLQSLKRYSVLNKMTEKRSVTSRPCEHVLCVRQNFILLLENLSGDKDEIPMIDHMYGYLDADNLSDILHQASSRRQKSKLLKILMIKGEEPCFELLNVLENDQRNADLLSNMEKRCEYMKKRGKPPLENWMAHLDISCLQEHSDIIRNELDALYICDKLFEEMAVTFIDHDKITEAKHRRKQMDSLLNTVKENKDDCFNVFLFILQTEEYHSVLCELKGSGSETRKKEMKENFICSLSHSIWKQTDSPGNKPVEVRVSAKDNPAVEQALYQHVVSNDTGFFEEAIMHGQTNIENALLGSVVLQLRPVTDEAVQTLLNAKENNALLNMIFGMLKQANIYEIMGSSESLELKVQVCYAKPDQGDPKSYTNTGKTDLIKTQIKGHRKKLLSELEPEALFSVLSKSSAFPQESIDEMRKAKTCLHRIEQLLTFVEKGNSQVVDEFFLALKNVGYVDVVKLIDPSDLHSNAETIRKKIAFNYKDILDEMQITLARETLSTCIGDVASIQENIMPKHGNHKQRMHKFLQFILQEDHNVMQFEKMLQQNGLEELLNKTGSAQGNCAETKDIEVKFIDGTCATSEDVLFESMITLSFTTKGVKNIPQNATESVEELQTLRHGSLKRRHPSEDKGDPWFLHEPGKKFIKPFHRFTRFIYPVRKTTPDNEDLKKSELENERPNLSLPPTEQYSAKRKQNSVYQKTDRQKGLALILNFSKDRSGSEVDFENIQDFFENKMGFEFHAIIDTSKKGVEDFLQETSGLFNNKRKAEEYYCLLVFIMIHGNEEGILTDDGKTISLEDIVSYFKNDKLKYFPGKPKCFFVHAYRGNVTQGNSKKEVMLDQVVGKISIPTEADLLLTYSTTPGYFSYRRKAVGSWFFHDVINVFKSNYQDEHLEEMLIDVKEKLAYDEKRTIPEGYKQMLCTVSTLTKHFFLK